MSNRRWAYVIYEDRGLNGVSVIRVSMREDLAYAWAKRWEKDTGKNSTIECVLVVDEGDFQT